MSLHSLVGHTQNNLRKIKYRTKIIMPLFKTFGNVRTVDSFFLEVIMIISENLGYFSVFKFYEDIYTDIQQIQHGVKGGSVCLKIGGKTTLKVRKFTLLSS